MASSIAIPAFFDEEWSVGPLIEQGHFADVHILYSKRKGFDFQTQSKFAVKIVKRIKKDLDDFMQEMKLTGNLKHENVIAHFCYATQTNHLFVMMELASESLLDVIISEVFLTEEKAFRYFKQLTAGIAYIHNQGIVHRDLNPRNLLVMKDDVLKICDFGLAAKSRSADGSIKGLSDVVGTLPYIAPEVFNRGKCHLGEPLDVWAAGIILVEMLSAVTPWAKATARDEDFMQFVRGEMIYPFDELSTSVRGLLRLMLDSNPETRKSLDELVVNKWFCYGPGVHKKKVLRVTSLDSFGEEPLSCTSSADESLFDRFSKLWTSFRGEK